MVDIKRQEKLNVKYHYKLQKTDELFECSLAMNRPRFPKIYQHKTKG